MWKFLPWSLLSVFLVSCATKGKETDPKTPPQEMEIMELVARVQSRPGNKDFVLLEAYGKWTLDEGVILFAYGNDGRSATLETSGEKLGQFVAADVKSGEVAVGDAVYHRTKGAAAPASPSPPKAPSPQATPAAPAPAEPDPSPGKIEPVPLPSY